MGKNVDNDMKRKRALTTAMLVIAGLAVILTVLVLIAPSVIADDGTTEIYDFYGNDRSYYQRAYLPSGSSYGVATPIDSVIKPEITDEDLNDDSGAVDYVSITIWSEWGDTTGQTIQVPETGANTGVFDNVPILLHTSATGFDGDLGVYTLECKEIDIVWFSYDDGVSDADQEEDFVYVDEREPVTTLTVGTPKIGDVITSDTDITLTATEYIGDWPGSSTYVPSGVDETEYRVWDSNGWTSWTIYSGPFSMRDEGKEGHCTHKVEYKSYDNGEEEQNSLSGKNPDGSTRTSTIYSKTLYVDEEAPTTTKTYDPVPYEFGGDKWITYSTQITLSASDNDPPCNSGLKTTYYRYYIQGETPGSFQEYTGAFTIGEECTHVIEYYSVDEFDNTETTKSQIVKVDNTPPTTTVSFGTPYYTDGVDKWITSATDITLDVTDGGLCPSGVKETWYRVYLYGKTPGSFQAYTGSFNIQDECDHVIEFYSEDNVGNTEKPIKTQRVNVDNTAPTTTKTYGTPYYTDGIDKWITTDTPITLTATDEPECKSGVKVTKYKINDGDWMDYSGAFTIDEECQHTIYYYSVDNLDNTETEKSQVVNVDETAPTTTKKYGTPFYTDGVDNWITTSTLITLTATDGPECECGVEFTYYRINGGSWQTYTAPFKIPEECEHFIEYYSVDYIGNTESPYKSQYVNVDDTPPTTKLSYGTPYYTDMTHEWIRTTTPITLTATDDPECKSGVKITKYKIDTGEWQTYTGSFTIDNECFHTIYYYSEDNIGHKETEKSIDVRVDDTPPTTTKKYGTPFYSDQGIDWITKTTLITLTATDEPECKSGVKTTYYKINDGEWQEYEGPFSISTECFHTIYYYSEDNIGNKESEKSQDVRVDDTPPTTIKTYGTPFYTDGIYNWITTSTEITLTATDEPECKSGVKETWYKYSEYWQLYTGPFTIGTECFHTIEYYSIDYLGNEETIKSQDVRVDNTPPTTVKTYGEPIYTDNGDNWITSSTEITLTATDEPECKSGIKTTYYRIGGTGEFLEYEGPFTIDEECNHLIEYYSEDNLGNTEHPYKFQYVNVDNTPPTTTISCDDPLWPETFVAGEDAWVVPCTPIILTSTDEPDCTKGVKVLYYEIWWDENGDGDFDDEYGVYPDIMSEKQSFTVYDGMEGDEDGKTNGEIEVEIHFYEECHHEIHWYAEDYLGQKETEKSQTFYVVSLTPEIEKTVGTPNVPIEGTDNYYVTSGTKITIDLAFASSGCPLPEGFSVANPTIQIAIWHDHSGTWEFIDEDVETYDYYFSENCYCPHDFYYRGGYDDLYWTHEGEFDYEGDPEWAYELLLVDNEPPASEKDIGDPKWTSDPKGQDYGLYVTTDTVLTLSAEDGPWDDGGQTECAVKSWRIYWEIWFNEQLKDSGVGDWYEEVKISFTEECQHKLVWWAEDNLGNLEEKHEQWHYVDNTAPTTTITLEGCIYEKAGSVAPKVLWDDTHDTDDDEVSGNYFDIYTYLSDILGYDITEYDGPDEIDETLLADYEMLVLLDIETSLSTDEITAIQNFVDNGGSLFVVGENPTGFNFISTNTLLYPYDIQWANDDVEGDMVWFDTHEITDGISKLYFEPHPLGLGTGAGVLSDMGNIIGRDTEEGRPILSYYENGGKVVAITDSNFMQDSQLNKVGYQNKQIVENIFGWLAPLGLGESKTYINSDVEITLECEDLGDCASGVYATLFRIWYQDVWYPYEEGLGIMYDDVTEEYWFYSADSVTFSMASLFGDYYECKHILQYFNIDNLGHREEIISKTFYVDDTEPVITKTHPDHGYYDYTPSYEIYADQLHYRGEGVVAVDPLWDYEDPTGWMYDYGPNGWEKKQIIEFTITNTGEEPLNLVLRLTETWGNGGITLTNWSLGLDTNSRDYVIPTIEPGETETFKVPVYDMFDSFWYAEWNWEIVDDGAFMKVGAQIDLTAEDGPIEHPECIAGIQNIYWRYEYAGTSYPMEASGEGSGSWFEEMYGYLDPQIIDYEWFIYNPEEGIQFDEECTHIIYYWAKDRVCHHTQVFAQVYDVDDRVPIVIKEHPKEGYYDDGEDAYIKPGAKITLTGEDVGGFVSTSPEILLAIDDGLAYLANSQSPTTGAVGSGYPLAQTAFAVLKWAEHATRFDNKDPFDETYKYYNNIMLGLEFMYGYSKNYQISTQPAGEPDIFEPDENNGIIFYEGSTHSIYETGLIMQTIVATDNPDFVVPWGTHAGWTQLDIVKDMVDLIAFAQNDVNHGVHRGGWRYGPNYGNSDNSNSQWPVLGLMYAEDWGVYAPSWVKSELLYWLDYSQETIAEGGDGGFGYNNWYSYEDHDVTGAGITMLTYCGVPTSDPRIQDAIAWIGANWNNPFYGTHFYQNVGFSYSMYAVMKAAMLQPNIITQFGTHNWQDEYDTWIIDNQKTDGSWYGGSWHTHNSYLDTAMNLLVLQRVVPGKEVIHKAGVEEVFWRYEFDEEEYPMQDYLQEKGDAEAELCNEESFIGSYAYHLKTTGTVGSGDEARIEIPMPEGTTLGDISSISWWEYLVSGYPPHVDILIDTDGDGMADDAIVFEYAYNDIAHLTGAWPTYDALTGAWYLTFSDDGDGPTQVDDTAFGWLSSGPPGPYGDPTFISGTLADWKAGTVHASVDLDTAVIALDIEIDNWISQPEAYVDGIMVNGETVKEIISGDDLNRFYGYTDGDYVNYYWYVYTDCAGVSFEEECQHDLYYWAKDNVCNKGPIYHQVYLVDDTPPESSKEIGMCNFEGKGGIIYGENMYDLVFIIDTSQSMDNEWSSMDSVLTSLIDDINAGGIDLAVTIYGLAYDKAANYPNLAPYAALMNTVFYDGVTKSAHTEDWGPGTSYASQPAYHPWRTGAERVIIAISDEGPYEGNPSDRETDYKSIDEAITLAIANDVTVYTFYGDGSSELVEEHMENLALSTGGEMYDFYDAQAFATAIKGIFEEITLIYVSSLTDITITATDEGECQSGVDYINYRITWDSDGDSRFDDEDVPDWITVDGDTALIHFEEECLHKLEWYSVDNVGNEEEIHYQYHKVDNTPPSITKTFYPENHPHQRDYMDFISSETTITLTAEDGPWNPTNGEQTGCVAGIQGIFWRYEYDEKNFPNEDDDGQAGMEDGIVFGEELYEIYGYECEDKRPFWWYFVPQEYINITLPGECVHILYYWAKDNVCNPSQVWDQTYYVDNTPPVSEKTWGDPRYDKAGELAPKVLWDDSHDSDGDEMTNPSDNYYDIAHYLGVLGYDITEYDGPGEITSTLLQDYDILVLVDVDITLPLTGDEITAIQAFVDNGGSVLVVGENPTGFSASSTDTLLEPYDIDFSGDDVEGDMEWFETHDITNGITKIYFEPHPLGFGTGAGVLVDEGNIIGRQEENGKPILSYYENSGKVVAITDSNFMQNTNLNLLGYQNKLLVENIFDWMSPAGAVIPISYITSDSEFEITCQDVGEEPCIVDDNTTWYRVWYAEETYGFEDHWTPWMIYYGPFTMRNVWTYEMEYLVSYDMSGDCIHYIEFYNIDAVGNKEETQNNTHWVDDTGPISYNIEPGCEAIYPEYCDDGWDAQVIFKFSAEDIGPCAVGIVTEFELKLWKVNCTGAIMEEWDIVLELEATYDPSSGMYVGTYSWPEQLYLGAYWWKVRSYDILGNLGDWSEETKFVVQASDPPPLAEFYLKLYNGWNYISIPVLNSHLTAKGLSALINDQVPGSCLYIIEYTLDWTPESGYYREYVVGFSADSEDFPIMPDVGYIVFMDVFWALEPIEVLIIGDEPHEPCSEWVYIQQGWNYVGWTYVNEHIFVDDNVPKASDVVKEINYQYASNFFELLGNVWEDDGDWLGWWTPYISDLDPNGWVAWKADNLMDGPVTDEMMDVVLWITGVELSENAVMSEPEGYFGGIVWMITDGEIKLLVIDEGPNIDFYLISAPDPCAVMAVAYYDTDPSTELEGFVRYDSCICDPTDFEMIPGYGYWIFAKEHVGWVKIGCDYDIHCPTGGSGD